MNKLLTRLCVVCSMLALSGCSIDRTGEKDKKITELEQKIALLEQEKVDDVFEKRQQCWSYKMDIEKDLLDKQNMSSDESKYTLEQIFYSPIKETCYLVSTTVYNENDIYIRRWLYEYGNHSSWSRSEFVCSSYYEDGIKVDNCDELDDLVQQLKGE